MKKHLQILITFFLIIFSQENFPFHSRVDSININLLLQSVNNLENENKINTIKQIVEYYINNSPKDAEPWVKDGITLAKSLSLINDEAMFYLYYGKILYIQSYYLESLEELEKALTLFNKTGNKQKISSVLNEKAYVKAYLGLYKESISLCYESEKISSSINDNVNLANAYNTLGIVYYILNDLQKAIDYSNKSLALLKNENVNIEKAAALVHLGIVFIAQKKFDDALEYTFKAIELYKIVNYKRGLAGAYENISMIYKFLDKYDKVLEYSQKSLLLKKEINDRQGIAASLANIGLTYWRSGDRQISLKYFFESLELRKQIHDLRGISYLYSHISEVYEELGNKDNALFYYKEFKLFNDSLINETKTKQISELSAQFENEKKEAKIKALQNESNYNKTVLSFLIIIIIFIATIGILLIVAYNNKRRSSKILELNNKQITFQKEQLEILNKELKELNSEKDKLFGIIAHDLRSPFQSILGMGNIIVSEKNELTKEEILFYSEKINIASQQVYNLLENLLYWALIKMDKLKIKPEDFSLKSAITKITELFSLDAEEKQLKFENRVDDSIIVSGDFNSLSIVFRNLISNAIKFSNPGNEIIINAEIIDSKIQIFFVDKGTGMSENTLNELFTPQIKSTAGTMNEKGTGLGLLVSKEIIELNNGSLSVKSELGKGTTFIVSLPIK